MVDVYVIQKQTALERYTRRSMNIDFFDYLEKAGQSVHELVNAHEEHNASRTSLLTTLANMGLSYRVMNLDELNARNFSYYDCGIEGSGFQPEKKLVLSLGGDGTLLHASHYVGGNVTLLGINSCPKHSVGHLCASRPHEIERSLQKYFAGNFQVASVLRLRLKVTNGSRLPLALNDALFCHQHPAATSRYTLTKHSKSHAGSVDISENQMSSGVWVSTPAGSSAAIAAYGLSPLNVTERKFLCAIREPYAPSGLTPELSKMVLDGESEHLSLFTRMRQGMICVDGPDSSVMLNFGETVHIDLPTSSALKLCLG